jgi:hypothetical protein
MIIVICDPTIVDRGRKGRKKYMEINRPYAVVQYNRVCT